LKYEELDEFADCIYVTRTAPHRIYRGKQAILKYEQIIFQHENSASTQLSYAEAMWFPAVSPVSMTNKVHSYSQQLLTNICPSAGRIGGNVQHLRSSFVPSAVQNKHIR